MLIEFSVANFRSFKKKQTLSMVASKSTELADTHTFVAPLGGKKSIRLLRSAAIYGANAAGKTNLLVAMETMRDIVIKSAKEQVRGDPLPVNPFRLGAKTRNEPSEFEMHFIADEVRYQYGFSATRKRVIEEWLIAYPHGRAQNWFSRAWSSKAEKYEWEFSALLTGEKKLWEKSTRDNALFLSTAVQLNSTQLQPLYDWFKNNAILSHAEQRDPRFTASFSNKGGKEKILGFLKSANLDIHDVHVKEEDFDQSKFLDDMPEAVKQEFLKEMKDKKIIYINTVRLDDEEKAVTFDLEDESSGTVKIFSLARFWIDSMTEHHIIIIDELHGHLHLALVKFLVNAFHNAEANHSNSQLIFTTHETSLLNQEFLRHDQIWFCEKAKDGSTTLYPLTDFHPRKGRENLELRYIAGAYGALPYIREA